MKQEGQKSSLVSADLSSALVFDIAEKAYDDRAIKYADDHMRLEERMEKQLKCTNEDELLTSIQVALSDCMALKTKNIELSEEIATKLGFAIEGLDRKKIVDSLTEENHKMRQEKTLRKHEFYGIEKSLEELRKTLHTVEKEVEKERKKFEKTNEDLIKKYKQQTKDMMLLDDEKKKIEKMHKQQAKDMKLLDDEKKKIEKMYKQQAKDMKLLDDEKKKIEKMYKQQAKDMKLLDDEKKKIEKFEVQYKKQNEQLLSKNLIIQDDRASMTEALKVKDEHIQKLSSQLHHSEGYVEFYKQESIKWRQEASKLTGQLNRERQQLTFATENISRLQQQVVELNKSREDALTRLSKLAGARLTHLSDPDRPTKLAEQFSELYDNQWTDSLEELTGNTLPEEIGVKLLLSIVLEAYRFCCKVHLGQKEALNAALVTLPPIDVEISHALVTKKDAEVEVDDELKSDLEILRRKVILNAKPVMQKRFRGIVLLMLQKSISKDSTDEEMETDVNEEDSEKAEKGNMEPTPLVQTEPPAADDSSRTVDPGVSELDITGTDPESNSVQQDIFRKERVPEKPSANTKEESGNQAESGKPVPLQETEAPAAGESTVAGVSELDKQGTALEAEASSEQQDEFVIVPDKPSASTKEESGSQAVSGKPNIGDKYDNVYLNKLQTTYKSEDDENRKKQKLWNSWSGEPNQRLVELQRASKSLSINDRRAKDSDIILILQGLTQPDNHVTVEEDYGKQYPCTFEFAKICLDICWKMRLQDPEVYMEDCEEETGSFNCDKYKAYSRTGKQLDYVVWPALYLHKNGPMLSKGVAQPKMKKIVH